jgi:hypothetical protein
MIVVLCSSTLGIFRLKLLLPLLVMLLLELFLLVPVLLLLLLALPPRLLALCVHS